MIAFVQKINSICKCVYSKDILHLYFMVAQMCMKIIDAQSR